MEPLSRDEALEFLESRPVAHLGTVLHGEPHVTPMSFVVDGDRILFRTVAGTKLEAIRSNQRVCIEVTSYDDRSGDWASAIVKGDARVVQDSAVRQKVVALLFAKYGKVMGSPLSRSAGLMPLSGNPYVIEVPITEITGMCSGRGMSGRTKPGRL